MIIYKTWKLIKHAVKLKIPSTPGIQYRFRTSTHTTGVSFPVTGTSSLTANSIEHLNFPATYNRQDK